MASKDVNWSFFTKRELIKTIKRMSERQTALLQRIAELEVQLQIAQMGGEMIEREGCQ
jgi:hypothetical protein